MDRLAKVNDFLKRDIGNEALAGAICNFALGDNSKLESYILTCDYLDFHVIDLMIDFFIIDEFNDSIDSISDYIEKMNNYTVAYNDGMMNGPIPTYDGVPLSEKITTKESEDLKSLLSSFYESLRHLNDDLLTKTYAQWTDEDLEILGLIPEAIGPLFNRPVTLGLSKDGEEYLRYLEDVILKMIRRPDNEFLTQDLVKLQALFLLFDYTLYYETRNYPPVFIPRYYHRVKLYTGKLMIRYKKKAVIYNELIS